MAFLPALLLASPLPEHPSPETPEHIILCEQASNCETYDHPNGHLAIRFKPGMEPGSPDYEQRMSRRHQKREDQTTKVTIGDNKLYWGCEEDPVKLLNKLGDSCKTSGQCVSDDAYSKEIDYLEPDNTVSPATPRGQKTLSIAGEGQYPSGMRNALVKAIQEAAGAIVKEHKHIQWNAKKLKRESAMINLPTDNEGGFCDVKELSSHIGLNVYKGGDSLVAFMEAKVSIDDGDGNEGFCKGLDVTASIAGALGPWGAAAGGFLGTVKAFCG
ncbi:MAG: hypothetical protein Q9174_003240 [Haloplaca sp. 1 TL-2023]